MTDKHSALSSSDNLGEVLAGDRRRRSLYDIRYNVDIQWTALCQFTLTQVCTLPAPDALSAQLSAFDTMTVSATHGLRTVRVCALCLG